MEGFPSPARTFEARWPGRTVSPTLGFRPGQNPRKRNPIFCSFAAPLPASAAPLPAEGALTWLCACSNDSSSVGRVDTVVVTWLARSRSRPLAPVITRSLLEVVGRMQGHSTDCHLAEVAQGEPARVFCIVVTVLHRKNEEKLSLVLGHGLAAKTRAWRDQGRERRAGPRNAAFLGPKRMLLARSALF